MKWKKYRWAKASSIIFGVICMAWPATNKFKSIKTQTHSSHSVFPSWDMIIYLVSYLRTWHSKVIQSEPEFNHFKEEEAKINCCTFSRHLITWKDCGFWVFSSFIDPHSDEAQKNHTFLLLIIAHFQWNSNCTKLLLAYASSQAVMIMIVIVIVTSSRCFLCRWIAPATSHSDCLH